MIGAGQKGGRDVAGRVSMVNESGVCVYDVLVKHKLKIKDYRTAITGITEANITNSGITYKKVKSDVADWIRGRILVGHDLDKLKKLGLSHPPWNKRDTAEYFRNKRTVQNLKNLPAIHLRIFNQGVQLPKQNAITAVKLYNKYQKEWDDQVDEIYGKEQSDEEMADEEMSGEEMSGEEMSGEEISGEEMSGEEMSDEEISNEEMSGEEMSGEEMSDEEISNEEMSGEEMSGNESEYTSSSDD